MVQASQLVRWQGVRYDSDRILCGSLTDKDPNRFGLSLGRGRVARGSFVQILDKGRVVWVYETKCQARNCGVIQAGSAMPSSIEPWRGSGFLLGKCNFWYGANSTTA